MKILFAFLIFAPALAGASEFGCPAKWRRRFNLQQFTVYDGPPKEMASLVPDGGDQSIGATWTFEKTKKRPVWIECRYEKTSRRIAKKLPMKVTRCELVQTSRVRCD